MDLQGSKIKFGFSKIIKKPNLVNQNGEIEQKPNKIELIEAIEGSAIKISGKTPEDEIAKKLIIPMTNDQKTTPLAKLLLEKQQKKNQIKIKSEENGVADVQIKQEPVEETLEQQAARELIEDLEHKAVKSETKVFDLPLNPDELPLEGAKESSLDDYDRVPISDFGKAMLRGMGWKDEEKDENKKPFDVPVLRPKGMGLGADKVIKKQPLLIAPNQSETLEIKRHACVKVLAGKHKNFYGTIEGFDDGGGRLIIKLAIGGLKVTINEFMVQPVGKAEFAKYSKVLNSEKYEEYKTGGESLKPSSSTTIKQEPETSKPRRDRTPDKQTKNYEDRDRRERNRSRERVRERSRSRDKARHRSRSRERQSHKAKSHYRDRSEESPTVRKYRGRSREDKQRRRSSSSEEHSRKKKSSKHKKHFSSPDTRYSSDSEKKHKKKTKKSKQRKRDRS